MKIASVVIALCLFSAIAATAQQEVSNIPQPQPLPEPTSWDAFQNTVDFQVVTLWSLLTQTAPIYGAMPTVEAKPTAVYVELMLETPKGNRYYARKEITLAQFAVYGSEQKLAEINDLLRRFHTEALILQLGGLIAGQKQMHPSWTVRDTKLAESVQDAIENVLVEARIDSQYRMPESLEEVPGRELSAMLLFNHGRRYIALVTVQPNDWGMSDYLVQRKYLVEDLLGAKAPETFLELQHDVLEIRGRDGYFRIPLLNSI